MLWFKKKKVVPWYQRMWQSSKAAIGVITTVFTMLTAGVGYLQINTESFERSTKVQAVSANNKLYTRISTQVELPEMSYVIVNINNTQVDSHVYPEGIKRGQIQIETDLPFEVLNDSSFSVTVDIYMTGFRTLFLPERLSTTIKVKPEKQNAKANNINNAVYTTYYYKCNSVCHRASPQTKV